MAVFHIILGHLTGIVRPLFAQEIHGVGFLKQRIAFIFFVRQHFSDAVFAPLGLAVPVYYPIPLQFPRDPVSTLTIQELAINSSHDFRLLFIDHQIAILVFVIAEKLGGVDEQPALLKPAADAPRTIFRDRT